MLPVADGRAPAQLRRRLYAVLIDALLLGVPFVFVLVLLGADPDATLHAAFDLGWAATGWGEWSDAPSAPDALLQPALLALSVLVYLFLCKRLWGESVGRRQAKVRIVVRSGATPSFRRLYVREIIKVVSIVALLIWIPVAAFPTVLEAFNGALCNYEPGEFHEGFCAVGAFFYAGVVSFSLMPMGGACLLWIIPLMRKDRRAVHDLLTNTLAARAESAAEPPPPARADD